MRPTVPTRSIAVPLALLWLLGSVGSLAAQGVPASSPPAAIASARPAGEPLTACQRQDGRPLASGRRTKNTQSLVAVAGSLAAVLGVFFVLAWLMRKAAPQATKILPEEAFEVLGRAPLVNHQQVQLLRCGRKLLLVSVTPSGAETLTEITDAAEVDRLATACRQSGGAVAFRRVLDRCSAKRVWREPLSGGDFSDSDGDPSLAAEGRDQRAWGGHV